MTARPPEPDNVAAQRRQGGQTGDGGGKAAEELGELEGERDATHQGRVAEEPSQLLRRSRSASLPPASPARVAAEPGK